MQISRGFRLPTPTNEAHVLKLLQNIYGTCQAGKIWFLFAHDYLIAHDFKQSTINPCVFYYRRAYLLLYVDDFIVIVSTNEELDELVVIIKDNVDVEDQGDICNYVEVHFSAAPDEIYEL